MKSKKYTSNTLSVAILIGSFSIAIAIIIYSLITYLISVSPKTVGPQQVYENIGYVKVDKSPTLGDKDAPITVIEYTDFDCPICKVASDEILPGLKKEYIATGKVKFIFKSLPEELFHKNAFRKTEGAYCALDQGGDKAFFTYYDTLFEKFGFSINLDNELTAIAQEQGLNTDQFQQCLKNRKYKDIIKEEVLEGNLIGSLGTPTWLIGKSTPTGLKDTIKINGLYEYAAFQTIINRQLAEL